MGINSFGTKVLGISAAGALLLGACAPAAPSPATAPAKPAATSAPAAAPAKPTSAPVAAQAKPTTAPAAKAAASPAAKTAASPAAKAGNEFQQLVNAAEAEMAATGGRLRVALEWQPSEANEVLTAFRAQFPFVKETVYERRSRVEEMQRMLAEALSGRFPEFDILHISSEAWEEYQKAGLFVQPPFEYRAVVDSLPADWPKPDDRALDPQGMFIAGSGLARGNAWNTNLVKPGEEPRTWDDCLDPKWKNQVVYDPRPKLNGLYSDPKTRAEHITFLEGLVKNAVLNRGQTENLEKVAAGEYAIACGINYHSTMRIIDEGAPIDFDFPDPYPLEFGTQVHIVSWSKTPATTQLFTTWLASKGSSEVEKHGYRGFPWDPQSRKFQYAQGKYAAICDVACVRESEEYNKLHSKILELPGT